MPVADLQKRYLSIHAFSEATQDDAGIIKGVSLCHVGEAKGHGCNIDQTTLQQLMECGKQFKTGVRVNLDHFSGIENACGYLDNLRISGEKLLGDLHLLKDHPSTALIKSLISTIPDTFGLSVFFNGEDEEKEQTIDGVKTTAYFARCEELFSADLVTEPAANPSGVFDKGTKNDSKSITVDNALHSMEPAELKQLLKDHTDSIHSIYQGHMDELKKQVGDLKKHVESIGKNDQPNKPGTDAADLDKKDPNKDEDDDMDATEMNAKMDERMKAFEEKFMEKAISAISSQGIALDAKKTASAPSDAEKALAAADAKKDEPKTFHEVYRANRSKGLSKIESLKASKASHWELYKAYCNQQENGVKMEPLDAQDKIRLERIMTAGRLL